MITKIQDAMKGSNITKEQISAKVDEALKNANSTEAIKIADNVIDTIKAANKTSERKLKDDTGK